MLRILIWFIAAETIHLIRRFGPLHPDIWYFAYGSNVSNEHLARRRVRVLEDRAFTLLDYRIEFHHPSPFQGVGFADVVPAPGSEVPGRLLRLPVSDALWLHLDELVFPFGRYRIERARAGSIEFFFYRSNVPVAGLSPSEGYLNGIVDGLGALGFPRGQLAALRANPTATPLHPAVRSRYFVRNPSRFPARVRPLVEGYERASLNLFRRIWSWSLFGNSILPCLPKQPAEAPFSSSPRAMPEDSPCAD